VPELPEVETVRRGLADAVTGRRLVVTRVEHPRATRRQPGGPAAFEQLTTGRTIASVRRRGKYLWWTFADDPDHAGSPDALVAHLGMSGQFRLVEPDGGTDDHVRVQWLLDDGRTLVFRDQRTFGWVLMSDLGDSGVPESVAHIGRDPFDPAFDPARTAALLAGSRAGIKRLLLAQRHVSGIGNIYADEALWRAGVHPDTPADRLAPEGCGAVVAAATAVMRQALASGGTSFDPLYVSVNGESGWFERSLDVYGRAGQPCRRCGALIVRERFTNRSSHRCPVCQPAQRP
jgi:formamidopyrimidine-DNA glycosylase